MNLLNVVTLSKHEMRLIANMKGVKVKKTLKNTNYLKF